MKYHHNKNIYSHLSDNIFLIFRNLWKIIFLGSWFLILGYKNILHKFMPYIALTNSIFKMSKLLSFHYFASPEI